MIQLEPLEIAVKRSCYVRKNTRVPFLIARRFIAANRPVRARFIEKIAEQLSWAQKVENRQWRFESHLDGKGIKAIFRKKCPEKILWYHLKWIQNHMDRMKDLPTTRKYMSFDSESKVRKVESVSDMVILNHAARHNLGEYDFVGPTACAKKKRESGNVRMSGGSQKSIESQDSAATNTDYTEEESSEAKASEDEDVVEVAAGQNPDDEVVEVLPAQNPTGRNPATTPERSLQ